MKCYITGKYGMILMEFDTDTEKTCRVQNTQKRGPMAIFQDGGRCHLKVNEQL
jgi:hypothetical protein